MDSTLLAPVGMARDDDHNRLSDGLFEPIFTKWVRAGRVQAHGVSSVRVRSAIISARYAEGRKVISGNAELRKLCHSRQTKGRRV